MKGISLLTILSLGFVSSGCDYGVSGDERLTWTEFALNDSLFISMPETYGKDAGTWTGRDTWGFFKSRSDKQVVFRFETGPGTPYSPGVVQTLADTHVVYPYGRTSPESHITYRYSDPIVIDIANQKHLAFYRKTSDTARGKDGVVLIESVQGTAFTEILFVSYAVAEEAEVLNILRTIVYRNSTFMSKV